jgi:hypothetical protein
MACADAHSTVATSSALRDATALAATVSSRERLTSNSRTNTVSIGMRGLSSWVIVVVDSAMSVWRHAARHTATRRSLSGAGGIERDYMTG